MTVKNFNVITLDKFDFTDKSVVKNFDQKQILQNKRAKCICKRKGDEKFIVA